MYSLLRATKLPGIPPPLQQILSVVAVPKLVRVRDEFIIRDENLT
jgi:hypothetical protein